MAGLALAPFPSSHCPITPGFRQRFQRRHRIFPPISCSSSSSSSSWEREESRWLREEQRWLREEQRWLRQESRWNSERESLLREIKALRSQLQSRRGKQVDDDDDDDDGGGDEFDGIHVVAREAKRSPPAVLVEDTDVKEMVLVEEARVEEEGRKGRRTLRKGAEGADVKEMQEELEKLGFYSGEEDMEFSIFSNGTERAVKTWQASLGTREDGIMSSELLENLFTGTAVEDGNSNMKSYQDHDRMHATDMDDLNGAPFSSATDISEVKQSVVKDNVSKEVDVHEHRVFLLGENRWEETSRLGKREKTTDENMNTSSKRCLTCRGEGRLMCTECDGTGEPNIEPQFLEWVDEGTKCPYCEGLGYVICDVCDGKAMIDD